jgi:hypothetical protein
MTVNAGAAAQIAAAGQFELDMIIGRQVRHGLMHPAGKGHQASGDASTMVKASEPVFSFRQEMHDERIERQ